MWFNNECDLTFMKCINIPKFTNQMKEKGLIIKITFHTVTIKLSKKTKF